LSPAVAVAGSVPLVLGLLYLVSWLRRSQLTRYSRRS